MKIDTNEIIFLILESSELEVDGIDHFIWKKKNEWEIFTGNAYS